MKGIKLSKTSWLILSAGVFVVILAGLGVTRSQQLREQSQMHDELSVNQARLDNIDLTSLQQQLQDLKDQVDTGQTQLDNAKERLRQTVVSVDVTDEFFKIADYSGVKVINMNTSTIGSEKLDGISMNTISLSGQVTGDLDKIIDFVINLNNGYATGHVRSAQITVPSAQPAEGDEGTTPAVSGTTLSVQMIIYSYEGN
jgi:hypothetical protein